MSVFYKYISKALWKASRNLVRDYRELELMQSGSSGTLGRFVSKSSSRTMELLDSELKALNYKNIVYESDSMPTDDGIYVFVNHLEGIENLKRATPFFGIAIVQAKIVNKELSVLSSVISYPAFAEVIYAENGQGAWLERHDDVKGGSRLRSSGESDFERVLVSKDYSILDKRATNFRYFGSLSYDLYLFASGKFDAIYIKNYSRTLNYAAKIFAKETGANSKVLESGDIIAVNASLAALNR
jgi:fructose-1,6-bisphosphatase/inositol monophosphatase family enzyme